MKVAIVHYWLVGMRGGEKVVENLCRLFPEADIFTHVYAPDRVSEEIRRHRVIPSFINALPRAKTMYQRYLPLMPLALEQFDLRGYDLILSSESGPAKGVLAPPGALHVCYCHSPMRYVWNMYHDYRERSGALTKALMPAAAHYIRNWDALSSMRVDHFIANSFTVRDRIQRYYRRDAQVIHPPVDVEAFEVVPEEVSDYFLMVGELVPYKRSELAIEAFNRMGLPLVVIGGGERLDAMRALAGPTVKILGAQPFAVLRRHYARCQALIFPGEEDFGIVPVEAQASGRPVIAYGRGGATETVCDGQSGLLFHEQSVEDLIAAVQRFKTMTFDPLRIAKGARRFSADRFQSAMRLYLERLTSRSKRSCENEPEAIVPLFAGN
ncbi:glycosyltransferase [Rhodoblastus sp.]|uniref:glycosyltransferase n=1 Tax=Rhodoblastus sp. TaxID=1962975 RepID=UPI003F961946